jgi:Mrp family chromosome partitioning ATPase
MLIVSVPQDMVSMIVAKAVNMVKALKVPLIGIVQNMSYVVCPDCGKTIRIFSGDSGETLGLPMLGELPMKAEVAAIGEDGINPADPVIQKTIAQIAEKVVAAAGDSQPA